MTQGFLASVLVYVMVGVMVEVLAVWQVLVLGSNVSFFVCKSE